MTARVVAPTELQPKQFKFTPKNMDKAREIIAKYPQGKQQSAVMPLLDLAQRQQGEQEGNAGWVTIAAMQAISEILDMAYIRVYEVATFYTMYNLAPVGKHFIQVCRTSPCWLRGSDGLTKACLKKAGTKSLGETSKDGKFTVVEVECLGACVNAPMVQINDDYYEDLDPKLMTDLMEDLGKGKKPKIGTQSKDRLNSAPEGGQTTLKEAG